MKNFMRDMIYPHRRLLKSQLKKEFNGFYSNHALQNILDHYEFETVLDIGSGAGVHSKIFKNHNKKVTSLDYGKSPYFEEENDPESCVVGDYLTTEFEKAFDCIWASHVLEHQHEYKKFLKKIYKDLKVGGVLAITVPPLKHNIVGGHVNLYNGGLLLYHLIISGFDCSEAQVLKYGYNISAVVKKTKEIDLSDITYDSYDMEILKPYFPKLLQKQINQKGYFKGDIYNLNWY